MRVIEAMIACVILIVGVFATIRFSSQARIEQGVDLEETAQKAMEVVNNVNMMKKIVEDASNSESKLRSLLEALLPPNTYYNLTITSALSSHVIAEISNIESAGVVTGNSATAQKVVTVSLPVTKIENAQLDVMIVLDRSGSMDETVHGDPHNKIYYTKAASKTFIDQLDPTSDRVGLVSFSDSATLNSHLTNDFSSVKSKIDGLSPNGYTDMGDAVAIVNTELSSNSRTTATLAMIFLTDGVPNRPCPHYPQHVSTCPYAASYCLNKTQQTKQEGALIYTIGIGSGTSDFNETILKEIQTNGYYYAPSATQLNEIYGAIAQDLLFAVRYDIVVVKLTILRTG